MALSADMTRLLEDLKMEVPGALQSGYLAAVFMAMDDLLDFSNLWYEDINFTLVVGQRSYTLTPPVQGRIVRLQVLYNPSVSTQPNLMWADRAQLILPNQIMIATTPSTPVLYTARVSKKLATVDADGAPDAPDWMVQRYRDQLKVGAMSLLFAQKNRPWGDPQQAVFRGQQFVAYKTTARIDALKSNVAGQTNWAYPHTYRPSTQRGA